MAFVPSLAVGGSHASRAPLVHLQVPRAQAAAPFSPEHPVPAPAALASAALAATALSVCALRRQRRTALSARKKWYKKFDDGPGSSRELRDWEKKQVTKYDEQPLDERRREIMGRKKKKQEEKKKEDPYLTRVSPIQFKKFGTLKMMENKGRQYIGKWKVPVHPLNRNSQTRVMEKIARQEALERERESEKEQPDFNRTLSPLELGELAKEIETKIPNPTVTCKTNIGDFQVEVFLDKMPITASNFLDLSYRGFYNGLHFHRVVKDFIIQFGCPSTQEPFAPFAGMHGPESDTVFPIVDGTKRWVKRIHGHIPDEFDQKISNLHGTLSMANMGKDDTGGSQFFINISDNAYLDWFDKRADAAHPVFGRVIDGWKVVKAISDHDTDRRQAPLQPVRMIEMIVDDWVDDEEDEEETGSVDGFGKRRVARGESEETAQQFQARKKKELIEGAPYGMGKKAKMWANIYPATQDRPLRPEDIRGRRTKI